MGILKPSYYNFIIQDSKTTDKILFNGRTSALMRIPSSIYPIAQNILASANLDPLSLPSETRPLLAAFSEGGYLIEDDLDELRIINDRLLQSRQNGPLHLIIAPTLNCNLACKYCYQLRSPGVMNKNVCDQIIEFVGQELRKGDLAALRVDWYGGEPLLSPKVISYLSGYLLNLAKESKCEYESSIATNGTLLDDKAVELLISNRVSSCQVTIDGPQEIHDNRRGYKNDNGSSFNRIIGNIKRIIGKVDLSVRINIDEDNFSHAFTVLEIFREEGFFEKRNAGFFPYMAIVGPINPNMHLSCNTVDISKFYEHNIEFQKMAFRYSGRKQLRPLLDFPFPVNAACGALRKNTFAFDPSGYYFKCALEMGEPGKECGHISDVNNRYSQCRKWTEYNPLDDRQCRGCNYLPFCMGNCPKTEFDQNRFYGRDGCVYWKNNLENIIRLYVDAIEEIKLQLN